MTAGKIPRHDSKKAVGSGPSSGKPEVKGRTDAQLGRQPGQIAALARRDAKDSTCFARRARRFFVKLGMHYRCSGEICWTEGWTENVSRSGVLFRGRRPLESRTKIDMILSFPTVESREPPGKIICSGKIVRAEAAGPDGFCILAAQIFDYILARGTHAA